MPVPDFSPGEVWTAQAADSIGLWKIDETAFTSVGTSGLLFDDLFSADYQNYKAIINIDTASTNLSLLCRFDAIATPYNYATLGLTAGNVADNQSGSAASSFLIGYIRGSQNFHSFQMDIFNPNQTTTTSATYTGFSDNAAGNSAGHRTGSALLNSSTAVTGLTLLTSTGTINGTIRVYGYRN